MLKQVLTIILAGGRGTRLEPLTRDRAKPAVPFGGQYRIICPECGHIVPVAALDEETHQLNVHCAHCGYNDDLSDEPKGTVASAA